MKIKTVEFIKSAAEVGQAPADGLPQLAVAGRSNVGKSTLINYLLGRRSLARTSGKPGHTRLLNFFLVNQAFYLVDLPGYGYAAVDRRTRGQWGPMVHQYLAEHPDLRIMLLLMDLRRRAEAEELNLMAWLTENRLPFIPVLTKIDKLKPQARAKRLRLWRSELEKEGIRVPVVPVSAHLKSGREELWRRVLPEIFGTGDEASEDRTQEV
jgi:GTP-binding protein